MFCIHKLHTAKLQTRKNKNKYLCLLLFFPEKLFAMRALAAKNRAKQTTLNMNLICIYGKQRDGGVLLQF